MTPIYTCSACMSICIFKNTLPSFLVCSVCAFACAPMHWQGCAHVAAMCRKGRQQFSCVSCVSVCVCHMCNTLRDWDSETGMALCSDIAEFVFDYCTRLRFWQSDVWAYITGTRSSAFETFSPSFHSIQISNYNTSL